MNLCLFITQVMTHIEGTTGIKAIGIHIVSRTNQLSDDYLGITSLVENVYTNTGLSTRDACFNLHTLEDLR